MSSADRHFSYPRYTQDEWDSAQDEIERLKSENRCLLDDIVVLGLKQIARDKLITELADALERSSVYSDTRSHPARTGGEQ